MQATIIINPIAGARHGGDQASSRAELARRVLADHGVDGTVVFTKAAGHATQLAHDAVEGGASIVFAWGGDGTINEIASALAFGSGVLALVPAGSGNGLARALGVPSDAEAALHHGLQRDERAIDIGEIGGRLFVNVAGIGLDALIASSFARSARRGLLPYLRAAGREFLTYEPVEYELDVDGERLREAAVLVAIANSNQYGNGATIAPDARLDDGVLDLVVIGRLPAVQRIANAPRLFTGGIANAQGVTTRRATRVRISAALPMLFHVDGEPVAGGTTLEARVHAGALRIRA
jgi:YegS/Rv2252/BmrU family lipid kinase